MSSCWKYGFWSFHLRFDLIKRNYSTLSFWKSHVIRVENFVKSSGSFPGFNEMAP